MLALYQVVTLSHVHVDEVKMVKVSYIMTVVNLNSHKKVMLDIVLSSVRMKLKPRLINSQRNVVF